MGLRWFTKTLTYAFRCGDASKYVLFKCAKAAAATTADGWICGVGAIMGATIVGVVRDVPDDGAGGDEESTDVGPSYAKKKWITKSSSVLISRENIDIDCMGQFYLTW